MLITRQTVAERIAAYLQHKLTLPQLVDWAENAMMESEFSEVDMETLRRAISRLGVADVRAFGLTWEDCEQLLQELGYSARVDIVAA
jgi:cobyrinic acid a,c-diamide synthase